MKSIVIVIVSHSKKIADGLAELINDFTPDVKILAFGGTLNQGFGSQYSEISEGISQTDFDEYFCFYDLGSSRFNLQRLQKESDKKIVIFDVSLIEGCFKCAVGISTNTSPETIISQLNSYIIKK